MLIWQKDSSKSHPVLPGTWLWDSQMAEWSFSQERYDLIGRLTSMKEIKVNKNICSERCNCRLYTCSAWQWHQPSWMWGGRGEGYQDETGQGLAPCAAGLPPGQTWLPPDKVLFQQQRNCKGPKLLCVGAFGEITGDKVQKKKETQLSLLKSQEPKQRAGSKSRVCA